MRPGSGGPHTRLCRSKASGPGSRPLYGRTLYRLAAKSGGVFINPALTEPFGLTLIEAAASAHEPHRVAFYLYELVSEFHG